MGAMKSLKMGKVLGTIRRKNTSNGTHPSRLAPSIRLTLASLAL